MPMHTCALPVTATSISVNANGRTYSILLDTDTFDRVGEDLDMPIIPLCGGDEFPGDSLEGQWKKGWDADISVFTARVNGGLLEMTGVAASPGDGGAGWINSTHPIPLLNELEVTVAMQTPVDVSDGSPDRDLRYGFYIRQDRDEAGSPLSDNNFFRIYYDIDEEGLMFILTKVVEGGAPTTLDSGYDYTMDGTRSTGDLEGTIWRIVIHDGVSGATSPEDVRHMHVYLKQSDTITNAEDAAEHQLDNSPYNISDFVFDVGYPAFRIWTQNATYWGTAIGSANGVDAAYLRVSHPSLFSVNYNFTEAYYGHGDVELWDGDPDSGGIRVYDEDHEFINDAYLQNGLLRLLIDYKANPVQYGLKLFGYYGAAWVQPFDQLWFRAVTSNEDLQFPTIRHIESLSPEKVAIVVRLLDTATVDDDYYIDVRITLERGLYRLKLDSLDVFPDQDVRFWFLNTTTVRFGYVQDDDVGDDDITEDGINTTPTDNFLIAFDDDEEAVLGVVFTDEDPAGGNARFFAEDGGDLSIEDVDAVDTAGTIIWVSLIPFILIANLFIEAEDGDYTGTTPGNDTNASPPAGNNYVLLDAIGNFLTLTGDYSTYQFNARTDLPEGRYRAIIRARYEDEETMRMYVWQDTANEYRNEENAKVTKTLAGTFGYHSVVFDITAADVSGTRPFVIVAEKSTDDADKIRIDYFLVVPIGDGESFPQDVAHAAMRDLTKPRRLSPR